MLISPSTALLWLFTPDDYMIYDKYGDGDPFEDEEYIRKFRVVLDAVRTSGQIKFEMTDRHGDNMFVRCRPVKLEYSEKDDKFRVITAGWRKVSTVNLARIRSCVPDRFRELISEKLKKQSELARRPER